MNQIKKYSLYNLSLFLITTATLLFFLTDGIYKIEMRADLSDFRLGVVVKGLFELFFFIYTVIFLNRQKFYLLFSIFILAIFFSLGQFFLSQKVDFLNFGSNLNRFFKYVFIILLYAPTLDILDSKQYAFKLLKLYKAIIWVNGIIIIIAFLFSIDLFRTYKGPWRFGYDGLLFAQNEASYFFIFALTSFYYRRFYLQVKEWIFWLVFVTSILVATKAVFLYVFLLFAFHLTQRVSLKKILITGVSTIIIGYLIFSSTINKILINSWQIFQYNYEKSGLLFALLSGRNVFITSKLIPLINKWSWYNFLIGGQDVGKYYLEMGLLDLFLFFGFAGMFLYLYVFIKIYNRIHFNYKFKLFFLVTLLGIVGLSGHFFNSSIAITYFIIFILINNNYQSKQNETKIKN